MLKRVQSRQHAAHGLGGAREGRKGVLDDGSFPCDAIEIRSLGTDGSVDANVVGAQGVDAQQNDDFALRNGAASQGDRRREQENRE